MNTIIMTSLLRNYIKGDNDERIAVNFGNINGIYDAIKKGLNKQDNMVFVASDKDAYDETDTRAKAIFQSFDMTLPFKHYNIVDGRVSIEKASKMLTTADLIVLSGGHVPTQNRFFEEYNLPAVLHACDNAVIIGISAGTMNLAEVVYCPPELEGEATDPKFVRFLDGLGLTTFNVYPHYNIAEPDMVDGKDIEKEYLIPDSKKIDIYALPDDSYIELTYQHALLHGEAYLFHNGKKTKICEADKTVEL